jgi:tetratricopeptide (TPR) repeat protein
LKRVKRAFREVFGFRGHDEFDDIETYRENLTSRHIKAKMAFKRASQVLRQDPNNAKAYYIQSIALIGLTKNEGALIALNKAQNSDPQFPGIYDLKCTIFAHLGRIEDALDALEKAERHNPSGIENYSQSSA